MAEACYQDYDTLRCPSWVNDSCHRVATYDDRPVSEAAKQPHAVNARIVELDAPPDANRSGAKDEDGFGQFMGLLWQVPLLLNASALRNPCQGICLVQAQACT